MLPFALLVDRVGPGAFWGPNRRSTAIYLTGSMAKRTNSQLLGRGGSLVLCHPRNGCEQIQGHLQSWDRHFELCGHFLGDAPLLGSYLMVSDRLVDLARHP